MIDNRFNALAHWDNAYADRYSVELDIISVELHLHSEQRSSGLPLIELLQTHIVDHTTNRRIDGMVGNNFSSYVRDYDFSVLLLEHNKGRPSFSTPDNFGELHGKLFKCFINSATYKAHFDKPPVICLSVSSSRVYHRTENQHPVLGVEYHQNDHSLTDEYFSRMGLKVRYFMPPGSVAPLAFYFAGDLLADYNDLELISTISTMETFQKIYRPEIYNANAAAAMAYRPSLQHQDYSLTHCLRPRRAQPPGARTRQVCRGALRQTVPGHPGAMVRSIRQLITPTHKVTADEHATSHLHCRQFAQADLAGGA